MDGRWEGGSNAMGWDGIWFSISWDLLGIGKVDLESTTHFFTEERVAPDLNAAVCDEMTVAIISGKFATFSRSCTCTTVRKSRPVTTTALKFSRRWRQMSLRSQGGWNLRNCTTWRKFGTAASEFCNPSQETVVLTKVEPNRVWKGSHGNGWPGKTPRSCWKPSTRSPNRSQRSIASRWKIRVVYVSKGNN